MPQGGGPILKSKIQKKLKYNQNMTKSINSTMSKQNERTKETNSYQGLFDALLLMVYHNVEQIPQ